MLSRGSLLYDAPVARDTQCMPSTPLANMARGLRVHPTKWKTKRARAENLVSMLDSVGESSGGYHVDFTHRYPLVCVCARCCLLFRRACGHIIQAGRVCRELQPYVTASNEAVQLELCKAHSRPAP
jgi:hypothetical protein